MSPVLKLPRLGETMEEGRIVAWIVEEGAAFARGDVLLEVETDKTVVEVPALGPGRLVERLVAEGDAVALGASLARLEIDGPDWTGGAADAPLESAAEAPPPAAEHAPEPPAPAQPGTARSGATRPRATPLARRLAHQSGLDLGMIQGTGRRGRIERHDVLAAQDDTAGAALPGTGEGHGSAIVLLHGFAADGTIWAGLSARLARAGRRVVAPDLPGHGANPLEARVPADLTAGLAEALRPASGEGPPHVVAHSMGALAAVALAGEMPVASLTLIAPLGLSHAIDAGFLRGLADPGSAGEVEHLLGQMVEGPLPLSAGAIAEIHATLSKGRLRALADALLGHHGQAVNLRGPLARAAERLPVRLILGHRDRIVPWEGALGVSPLIAVHHLSGAGHMPHWEEADAVFSILERVARGAQAAA